MIAVIKFNNKISVPVSSADLKWFVLRCVNFSVEQMSSESVRGRYQVEARQQVRTHCPYLSSFLLMISLFSNPLFSLSFIFVLYTSHAFFLSNSLSESFLILSFQRMDISCFIERDKAGVLGEVQLLSLRKDLVYCLGIGNVDFSLLRNSFGLFFCGLGILGVMR